MRLKVLLAIDPGNIQSAWVIMDDSYKPLSFEITENNELLRRIRYGEIQSDSVAIEMIASYGMAVGKEVFNTCVWIGRFHEANVVLNRSVTYTFRKDVKMNLCGNMRAKDTNIRQALMDRFGTIGIKKNPGWFYGFKKDIWAAYAVGVTYLDNKH